MRGGIEGLRLSCTLLSGLPELGFCLQPILDLAAARSISSRAGDRTGLSAMSIVGAFFFGFICWPFFFYLYADMWCASCRFAGIVPSVS